MHGPWPLWPCVHIHCRQLILFCLHPTEYPHWAPDPSMSGHRSSDLLTPWHATPAGCPPLTRWQLRPNPLTPTRPRRRNTELQAGPTTCFFGFALLFWKCLSVNSPWVLCWPAFFRNQQIYVPWSDRSFQRQLCGVWCSWNNFAATQTWVHFKCCSLLSCATWSKSFYLSKPQFPFPQTGSLTAFSQGSWLEWSPQMSVTFFLDHLV